MLKKCDGRTNKWTNEQTDLCIELRYAQLIKLKESSMNFNHQKSLNLFSTSMWYLQSLPHDFNSQRLVLHVHLQKAAPNKMNRLQYLFTVRVSHGVSRAAYQGISSLAGQQCSCLVFRGGVRRPASL